jgi:ABC-2 type transport system ATP-binding protein
MAAAISVEHVSKTYRLYHERNQSLKAAILRRARVRYESFPALDDVSLEIPAGETFGLIGENGSGKSTLLKCIARILRPDAGAIRSEGKISALLELGAGFHPELSGRDNVYLNGAILGLSKKQLDARFDDIVAFAGLEHFIDTPVKNYSSGMYVRLGFSVAINVDPDILLVDEVLAVGDEEFQRRCAEKFAELKHSGKTVVIVSHALGTVRNLCDEVALLEHGKLRAVGPAGEVIDSYVSDVHVDRQQDGDYGTRWGSGEGRIERVELLGRGGTPVETFRTGDPFVVRLHYSMSEPIPKPVFGVGIQTIEGFTVTGPNTRQAGAVPDQLSGTGHVDLAVDRLMLAPGTYDLSVSLYDYSCAHAFDHRHRTLRFDVDPGDPHEEHGVVALGGRWEGAVGGGGAS